MRDEQDFSDRKALWKQGRGRERSAGGRQAWQHRPRGLPWEGPRGRGPAGQALCGGGSKAPTGAGSSREPTSEGGLALSALPPRGLRMGTGSRRGSAPAQPAGTGRRSDQGGSRARGKAWSDAGEALKPEARTLRRNPRGNEEPPRNAPGHLEERVCHLQGQAHVKRGLWS